MQRKRINPSIDSVSRYRITPGQYVVLGAAVITLIILGITSFVESQRNITESKVLSNVETPAASIIFTQRETLAYATRLAQWSNGGIPRRDVQIARNLLAQRLSVVDSSGRSMGTRANPAYWKTLRLADSIVASAPVGVVPESLHDSITQQINPAINAILAQSRSLTASYQRFIDNEMATKAKRVAQGNVRLLFFFYAFILLTALFLTWNARTNFANYRLTRSLIKAEQEELQQTITQLKETQSTVVELKDLNESKNAFISTVNHELRTPLTSIIGYIEVIQEIEARRDSKELDGYLEVIDRNAQILLGLVEGMLSLSKIDSLSGRLPENKVNISEVLDSAIFLLRPSSEKAKINIELHQREDEVFDVQGDAGQLSQVFINLLSNAIKFSPENSSIEITLANRIQEIGRTMICVSIVDHGIGIPSEDIEKLFTRFFRAKNAVSEHIQGTGLGLAIVKQAIELHHGTISIESEVGKGTRFNVEIPEYLSEQERLISSRRREVLVKAIAKLTSATPTTIDDVTHDIGGSIGFYGFEELGRKALELSAASEQGYGLEPIDIETLRQELLGLLTSKLDTVTEDVHAQG